MYLYTLESPDFIHKYLQEKYLPLEHGFQEWFGAPNCHFKVGKLNKILTIPIYFGKPDVGVGLIINPT